MTRCPAASSTSAAARAISGWKKLVKVSGQRRTVGEDAERKPARKVRAAKAGTWRCGWIPASFFASAEDASPLAIPGSDDASRAHQGTRPMA